MAIEIKTDKLGGEYKVDEGTELYAIWVPVTLAEKEALIKKGKAESIDVPKLTANFLREWLKAKELSEGELKKVAGGVNAGPNQLNLHSLQLAASKLNIDKLKGSYSTVMCPW